MRRIVGFGAAASCLGALIGGAMVLRFAAVAPRAAQLPRHDQPPAELAQLRSDLDELRAELRALQRTGATQARTVPPQACAQSASVAKGAVDHEAVSNAALPITAKDVAEAFASAHARDRRDRGSAMRYETEVQDFFEAHGPEDVVLDEVTCGDTLCRIRVEHASDEARQWFSDALGDERFGSGSFVQQADEGLASVAYVGRKGVDFRIPTALNVR